MNRLLRAAEHTCLWGGVFAIAVFATGYAKPRAQAIETVASFQQMQRWVTTEPDMSLWSPERIAAYEEALGDQNNPTLGVIRIDSVNIEAPIYPGDSDAVLDRGVGWIEGTTQPGRSGNVGLAAHRDGFFRGLKDIAIGDSINTSTLNGNRRYTVTGIEVITPDDSFVLQPTASATLTLVTCYPFYFVGSAPNRFVVYAMEDSP
jgi:sortase A